MKITLLILMFSLFNSSFSFAASMGRYRNITPTPSDSDGLPSGPSAKSKASGSYASRTINGVNLNILQIYTSNIRQDPYNTLIEITLPNSNYESYAFIGLKTSFTNRTCDLSIQIFPEIDLLPVNCPIYSYLNSENPMFYRYKTDADIVTCSSGTGLCIRFYTYMPAGTYSLAVIGCNDCDSQISSFSYLHSLIRNHIQNNPFIAEAEAEGIFGDLQGGMANFELLAPQQLPTPVTTSITFNNDKSVKFTWTHPEAGATNYCLQYRGNPGAYSTIGTCKLLVSASARETVTTALVPISSNRLCFRLKANGTVASNFSSELCKPIPWAANPVLKAPSNLNISPILSSPGNYEITWKDNSNSTTGGNESRFEVAVNDNAITGKFSRNIYPSTDQVKTYLDYNKQELTLSIKIRAHGPTEIQHSDWVSIEYPVRLRMPTNLTLTENSTQPEWIDLNWTKNHTSTTATFLVQKQYVSHIDAITDKTYINYAGLIYTNYLRGINPNLQYDTDRICYRVKAKSFWGEKYDSYYANEKCIGFGGGIK